MRRLLFLAAAALCLLVLAAPALARKPLMDCPTEHRQCYADAGKGAYLGRASCPQCWSWRQVGCVFCWGDKEPSRRCQNKYPACKGNCWSCLGGRHGCCVDKDGHAHGCDDQPKRKPQS